MIRTLLTKTRQKLDSLRRATTDSVLRLDQPIHSRSRHGSIASSLQEGTVCLVNEVNHPGGYQTPIIADRSSSMRSLQRQATSHELDNATQPTTEQPDALLPPTPYQTSLFKFYFLREGLSHTDDVLGNKTLVWDLLTDIAIDNRMQQRFGHPNPDLRHALDNADIDVDGLIDDIDQ